MDRSKWENKKLGDCCQVINGLWTGKKPPFINVGVIRNANFTKSCELDTSNIAYIDVELKAFEKRKLIKGDIIIEKSGGSDKQPVGRPILFNMDGDFSFSNFTSTLRIEDRKHLDSKFLHKVLKYYYLIGNTKAMQSNTTGLHNLDFTKYKAQRIPIPPIADQQRIVAELDCLNEMIALKQEQLKEFDKLAQSIFYDMFGDKDFPMYQLKDILSKIGSGATPSGGNQSYKTEGISLIRSLNVHNNLFVYKDLAFIDEQQAKQLNNVTIEEGDVLLNITGASVARCCVVPNDVIPARVNQHVSILRPRKELLDSLYLCHFLISCDEQAKLLSLSRSKAATREALPKNLLEKYSVPLPPLALQQQFAEKIQAIEAQKELVKQSIAETQQLLDSRMYFYFD